MRVRDICVAAGTDGSEAGATGSGPTPSEGQTHRRLLPVAVAAILLAFLAIGTEPVRTQAGSPGGVATNLVLWLKGSTGIAGTSPVTAWNDQSGNANHATTQIGTGTPTLVANGLNFHPVVNFPGGVGLQGAFGTAVTTNNASAYIVLKPNTVGSAVNGRAFGINLSGLLDHNNGSSGLFFYRSAASTLRGFRANGALSLVANVFDRPGLLASHFKTGNQHLTVSGGTPQAPATQATTAFNSDRYNLAASPDGSAANFLAADIAEIVFYTADQAAAGTAERIQSYLALKYGVSLSHNYLASDGTTIFWDQTVNAGYTNNVAGIGRDDGSGLVQRQSRSGNTPNLVTIGLGTIAADNASHGGLFAADRDFMMWGDNGASDGFDATIAPPAGNGGNRRMPRAWRIDETGTVGQVKIGLPAARGNAGPLYVIVSGDDTFDSGDQWIPLTAFTGGTTNYLAADVDFADGQYFTFAADLPAPGGVALGLNVWLKANAGTPVDGSNNFVSGAGWLDQSGHGRNADTVISDPQKIAAGINFNPTVVFDGTDYMRFGLSPFVTSFTAAEVFSVVKANNGVGAQNNSAFDFGGASNSHYVWSNDYVYNDFGTSVRFSWHPVNRAIQETKGATAITGLPVDPRSYHIYATRSASADWGVHYDGFDVASTTTNTANFTLPATNETVGASSAQAWNGETPEIFLYNRTLSATERQKINTYLAIKYGVTQFSPAATAQDYMSSQNAVIWNGPANSAYHTNVAGIGRDDGSALDQRQSLSINTASFGNLVTIGHGAIAADNLSNANAFGADGTFMVWGDNGASLAPMTPVAGPVVGLKRMARIWRVEETGTVGAVQVRIPTARLAGTSPVLIRSGDATFASGNTFVPLTAGASGYDVTLDFPSGEFFTFASVLPAPGDVLSGLEYWIRPEDMALSSTGVVTNWNDVYQQHTDEVHPGGGFPTSAGFNFHPTAFSTGTNRYMSFPGKRLLTGATAGEIFYMVENTGTSTSTDGYPGEFGGAAAATGQWEYDLSDRLIYSGFGSTTRKSWNPLLAPGGGPARNVEDPHIYNVLSAPAEWTARFDGVTNFTTATNAIQFDSSPSGNTYVGASHSSVFRGKLSEVIAYRRALTPTERQRVQSYLATKYGVTLGTTASPADYLASDQTTVYWTGSATYQNNVAGIGRDELSGLNQKQSRSVNTLDAGDVVTIGLGPIAATNAANANTFAADRSFMAWGDDAGLRYLTIPFSGTGIAAGTRRMPRVWRAQETGTVGTVQVRVPLTLLVGTNQQLIRSTSPTFASGNTIVPLTAGASGYEATTDFNTGDYFTFAAVPVGAPGGVAGGLNLWLKADAGVNVNASNNFVNGTGWLDQSGYGRNANMVFGDPQRVAGGINFNPTIDFDGGDYLRFGASPFANTFTAGEAFSVVKDLSVGGANHGFPYDFGGYSGSHYTAADASIYEDFGTTDRFQWNPATQAIGADGKPGVTAITGPSVNPGPYHIYSAHSAAGDWGVRFDGATAVATTTNSVSFALSGGNEHIGARSGAVFHGRMPEVFLYDRTLTEIERRRVNSYLAIRYGITQLAPGAGPEDYLSSLEAVIWNGVANSAYHNDVAGLGRDDLSVLVQKQSASVNPTNVVTIGLGTIAADNQSNTSTFPADQSFMVWGSSTASTSLSIDLGTTGLTRMGRVWRVQESGAIGSVVVRVPTRYVSGRQPSLVRSADAAFTDADTLVPLVRNGANYEATLDFAAQEYFSFASILFVPGGINGDALWVRADDGLLVDATNQVEEWLDRSGSGNTITEARAAAPAHTDVITPSSAIVRVASGINFNPVADFTGASGQSLKADAATEWDLTAVSIFAVAVREGAPGSSPAALFSANASWEGGTAGIGLDVTSSAYGLDGSGCNPALTTSSITQPRLVRGLYATGNNANGGSTWIDGTQEGTGTACATAATTFFEIGGRTAGAGALNNRVYNGKIAEVIVYKAALTPAETNRVESYLAIKYGITLRQTPARDYVDSAGAPVWDSAANATYRSNIAGIGRDDVPGLAQRQSKSSSAGDFVTVGLGAIAADNLSNPNNFGVDKSFLIWGHDNASAAWAPPVPGTLLRRVARVWRAQETGTVGTVVVRIPRAIVGALGGTLLRSVDPTFDNADSQIPMTVNGSYLEATIDFASGDYFTFASQSAPSPLNAGDGTVTEGHVNGMTLNTPVCPAYFWQHTARGTVNMEAAFGEAPGVGTAVDDAATWVADVTGDTIPDLVYARDAQGLAVWPGSGNGTFALTPIVTDIATLSVGSLTKTTFLADVSGDGALDVLLVHDGGGVAAQSRTTAWLGNGDGTFSTTPIDDVGLFTGSIPGGNNIIQSGEGTDQSTFLVDLNGDGRLDVMWVHNGAGVAANAGVWTWLGNGDGTFQHTPIVDRGSFTGALPGGTNIIQAGYSATGSTHAGDFNGDSRIDILWVHDGAGTAANSGTWFWAGNGDGTFGHTFVADQGTFTGGPGGNLIQAGANGAEVTRTADVNNDGSLDIVWATQTAPSGVVVWLGQGNGTFAHAPMLDRGSFSGIVGGFDAGVSTRDASFLVDLNGDGALDYTWVYDGSSGAPAAGAYVYMAVDTDGDGIGDLVDADDDNDGIADATDACPVPGSIGSGLQLWLKADAGTTVDGSNNFMHWADQSTFARDANLVTSDPLKVDAGVNFNPTVRFDGDDDFRFGKSPFVTGFTAGEVFTVVRNNAASTAVNGFAYDFGSSDRTSHYTHSIGGGSIYDSFGTTDRLAWNPATGAITDAKAGVAAIAGPAFATQDFHLYSGRSAANDWGVSIDGIARAATTTNTTDFTLSASNELVGHNSVEGLNGDVAEVILYNRTLTVVERQEVNSYLATKYGITLGHSYRASDGTTIYWDMAVNAAHHNNVAGIGRDDGATLNQRQSIGINPGSLVTIGLDTLAADNPRHPGAFAADRTFMHWGDNNASTTFETAVVPPVTGMANRRMARVWKVQETGAVASAMLGIPETIGSGSTVYLVVSNDETFDGTDQWLPLAGFAVDATAHQATTVDFNSGQFFTFATSLNAPGGVTGSAWLWVKANDGPSATNDGASVATWQDHSGALKNLWVMDDTKDVQPTYVANALNFNPAVSLLNDATSDQGMWNESFLGADDISYNIDGSVFFAHIPRKATACNTLGQLASPADVAAIRADHSSLGHCANNANQLFGTNDYPTANAMWSSGAALTAPPDEPALSGYTWRYNVANSFSFRNNGAAAATSITPGQSGRDFYLLRDGDDNVNDGAGEVSEAVMYTRQLSPVENQKVESYLAMKYGITLGQVTPTSYLDSTSAAIWNAAAAGARNRNIAGIGRDDVSTLVQRQSRSVNVATGGDLVTIGLGTIAIDNMSNPNTFAVDRSFAVWSDDGAAVTFSGAIVSPAAGLEARMARTWFIQETGAVGTVKTALPLGTGGGAPVFLVVSNDAVFDGSDVWRSMVPFVAGPAAYLATDIDFVSGQYFTFATALPVDYGDAAASYGTLTSANGPRHAIVGYDIATDTAPLMLGTRVDAEIDGQPSATGAADDTTAADDEDGVVFAPMSAGQPASVSVAVTNSGSAARLNAWADWNGNGSFTDVGEQIATDLAVNAGENTVNMNVPPGATGTVTFRFRLSTQAGLAPTGAATDGEVEDYQVALGSAETRLTISKTDGQASYVPGAAITYTITVTNAGPANASGVSITDNVPASVTGVGVNCIAAGAASCGANATAGNTVLFTGGSISAGAGNQLTLTVQGAVSASMTGDLTNTASLTLGPSQTDSNMLDNQATDVDTQGASQANLEISKTGPATVMVDETVTYILTVTNHGPSIATNVVVTDSTPPGLTFVSAGTGCTTAFPCALGTMAPGEFRQISATYHVPPGYTTATPIDNTASVSGSETDTASGNNQQTVTTTALPTADIEVLKTVDNPMPLVGETVTFTVTMLNHGPSDATGVEVRDVLPPELTLGTVTPSHGTFDPATGRWTVGSVPLNGSATLTLAAMVNAPGTVTNLAVKSAQDEPDPKSGNDSAGVMLTGAPSADLWVDKSVDRSIALVGENVTFIVQVTNRGPSPATGVTIDDPLRPGLSLVSGTPSQGAYDSATGAWTVGDLSATGQATLTIVATLTQAGPLVNQASIRTSNQADPNLLNDTFAASVNAQPNADILVAKSVSNTAPSVGANVTYTVAATNLGPSDAGLVDVLDALPAGLSFVSASASHGSYDQTTGLWSVGPLSNTATALLTITATVTQNGAIDNTAARQPGAPVDPNAANDNQTATLTAGREADLALTKTPSSPTVQAGTAMGWTIVVTNNGPSPVTDATVTDTFQPAFLSPTWACVATSGSSCAAASGSGNIATTVTLLAGGTATFSVTGIVHPSATALGNMATTWPPSDTTDPLPGNNRQTSTVTVTASADLQIAKTGPATARRGTTISYTIAVTNAGPASAPSVTVTDPTPAGLSFSANSGACTTPFPCALSTMAPGETRTITATYAVISMPGPTLSVVNTASVSSTIPDPIPANTATATTLVGTGPSCDVNGDGISEFITGAGPGGTPHVRIWTYDGGAVRELTSFLAYSPAFVGGVSVACRDLTGDGVAEVVTGAGRGGGPHVRIWQYAGSGVQEISGQGFYAYSPRFRGGVRVAVGDVDGDGLAELITAAGPGGGPHVRIWSLAGGSLVERFGHGFYADDPLFPGGAFVGAGDVDGDGVMELVTGIGPGQAPRVTVWSLAGGALTERASFDAYDPLFPAGLSVALGDIDGDGVAEVITGAGPGGGPHVRIWRVTGSAVTEQLGQGFYAYSPSFRGGVHVAAGDIDGDGVDEIITGAGRGGGPHVRLWKIAGGVLVELYGEGFYAYDPAFRGGANVGR